MSDPLPDIAEAFEIARGYDDLERKSQALAELEQQLTERLETIAADNSIDEAQAFVDTIPDMRTKIKVQMRLNAIKSKQMPRPTQERNIIPQGQTCMFTSGEEENVDEALSNNPTVVAIKVIQTVTRTEDGVTVTKNIENVFCFDVASILNSPSSLIQSLRVLCRDVKNLTPKDSQVTPETVFVADRVLIPSQPVGALIPLWQFIECILKVNDSENNDPNRRKLVLTKQDEAEPELVLSLGHAETSGGIGGSDFEELRKQTMALASNLKSCGWILANPQQCQGPTGEIGIKYLNLRDLLLPDEKLIIESFDLTSAAHCEEKDIGTRWNLTREEQDEEVDVEQIKEKAETWLATNNNDAFVKLKPLAEEGAAGESGVQVLINRLIYSCVGLQDVLSSMQETTVNAIDDFFVMSDRGKESKGEITSEERKSAELAKAKGFMRDQTIEEDYAMYQMLYGAYKNILVTTKDEEGNYDRIAAALSFRQWLGVVVYILTSGVVQEMLDPRYQDQDAISEVGSVYSEHESLEQALDNSTDFINWMQGIDPRNVSQTSSERNSIRFRGFDRSDVEEGSQEEGSVEEGFFVDDRQDLYRDGDILSPIQGPRLSMSDLATSPGDAVDDPDIDVQSDAASAFTPTRGGKKKTKKRSKRKVKKTKVKRKKKRKPTRKRGKKARKTRGKK